MSGATAQIAEFACAVHDSPPAHADHVGRTLIDTVGCALAATGSPLDTILRRWSEGERSNGRATVWTTRETVAASQAAFLNGSLAHALDWDDVSPGAAMHPSTVLLPALLAAAEEYETDGASLVAAYDVGAAVFRAVAHALPRAVHYGRGWHTTSTVGRLAAVAALARLRRFEIDATRNALGFAASLAAGSLANFGTMTKPLHAGAAARDAILAVSLAAAGLTANPRQLEADDGFFAMYGDPSAQSLDDLPDALENWRAAWAEDWAVKLYPACYATHRAIDAAIALHDALGGRLPERVEVVVEPGGLRPLLTGEPSTPTEAKFSMAYAVAVALVRGEVRLHDFGETALDDPMVHELLVRVSARESGLPPTGPPDYRVGYAVVDAEPGGTRRVDETYGDAANPLSDADLESKFGDCCEAAGISPATSDRLTRALRRIPTGSRVPSLQGMLRT